MKILCYGVKEIEQPIFNSINKKYQYELTFTTELLNDDNVDMVRGYDALILFVNCVANAKLLKRIKSLNVKYIVTRTAGFNHIDVKAAKELGYIVANVPNYSPSAIASLALSLGLSFLRKSAYINFQAKNYNFKADNRMLAKEIKNCTIGILGTGKIGFETAKMWKNLGAKVIAYDPYQNAEAAKILTYYDFDTVIKSSDLVSIHIPYFPGQNDEIINKNVIEKMQKNSFLVNCARGELVATKDIIMSIKSNHLEGYATDVVPNEHLFFGKDFNKQLPKSEQYDLLKELIDLYPRVLLTPHLAYFTDEAVKNMVETSFSNLKQIVETNACDNEIKI